MRTFLVILAVILVVLSLFAAFAAGYVVHDVVSGNSITPSQAAQAKSAGDLERFIIEELQGNYYKKVDVNSLEQAGVTGLLKSLNDPWTVYMTPTQTKAFQEATSGSYSGIGAALEKKGNKLLVTEVFDNSPAKDAGIKSGDWIVSVDGLSTMDQSVDVAITHIKGTTGTKLTLGVRAGGKGSLRMVTLTRRQILLPETRTRLIHRGGMTIGYIDLYQFAKGVGATVHRNIQTLQQQGAKAFVFDLRFNGGGLIDEAVNVTSDFLNKGVVVTTQGLHSPKEVYTALGDAATSLPVVVLVNRWTASASEITAGALQDHHRATVIGTRTFGKGLVQTIVDMPGGATLKITIAVYLTPNGRDINHKGITPTVFAKDDPKTKTDEALNRALQYVVTGH